MAGDLYPLLFYFDNLSSIKLHTRDRYYAQKTSSQINQAGSILSSIDISSFSPGMYMIRMSSSEFSYSEKVFIE